MTGPPRTETGALSDLLSRVQAALSERYRVERAIGRGGMGTVFAAQDLKHHRRVAIKVLRPELAVALGPDRFLREIDIAASLNHPHIVPLHDSGAVGGLLYYVMPLVNGESLRDLLTREVQMSVPDAVAVARETADALGFAHGLGIVHRDVKPENILLEGGHAVVADFGVARAISEIAGRSLTDSGLTVGTPAYMSPEQAGGGRAVDGRSDQYALACVMYELLAGVPPFTGPTPQAILARQLADTPPALHIVRAGIPPPLEKAITRGLAKVPADRFPTIQAFGTALTAALTEQVAPAGRYGPALLTVFMLLVLGLGIITLRGTLGRSARPVSQSTGLTPLPTSIAVLYFDDRSQNGGLEHLAAGLTEDLIDRLAGVKALRVISPDGVRPLRGKVLAPDSVARLFDVGTLVTGSVLRAGNRLRVSVRLIDAFSGVQLSSESLEQPVGDLLALRDRLSEEVAQQLRQRLGEAVQLRERRKAATVPQAWDLVLRAEEIRRQTDRLTLRDSLTARGLFREADTLLGRAQGLDSAWAEPTTIRGWLAYDQAGWGFGAVDSGGVPRGRVATAWITTGIRRANEALRVAPGDPGALELRGTLRYRGWVMSTFAGVRDTTGELALAETDLRAAAEAPGSARPRALSTLSSVLQFAGKLDEANIAARQAYEADAFFTDADGTVLRLFDTSLELGRFGDAAGWCDRGVQTFPDNWRFRMCRLRLLAWSPEIRPDVPTAWHLLSELDSLALPDERTWLLPQMRLAVAAVIAAAGLRDSAERVIAAVGSRASGDPDLLYYEALARARLGQTRAVARLLQVLLQRIPNYEASLRSDLEFRDVWPTRPLPSASDRHDRLMEE
jgi:eukaryotic-like serine/threonine-protein kinase